ncbi:hypothetical protein K435DRAFT_664817 [Dendrothele bispora CBS 962.96]|uniref:Uncharacterized protein n=1 Tax=Dendrothele bispora (strain CBS 962.96) TaxID=1314807 RepID=A0A4S8M2B2_DENBC|nr:hypothetical protein K435DRAFT_664817 [Dendrothele bispora CBS 962.96]
MTQGGASLLVYLATSTVLVLSYFFISPQIFQKNQNVVTTPPNLRKILSSLVLLHSLFILYNIIVLQPPNLFTRLGLPLGTPTDSIRSILLMNSDEPTLPKHIEQLLTRLGSFELRTLYVRFGHDVVTSCEFCSTFNDFALYAFPAPLLSYIREIALIGLITLQGTRHEQHRSLGVGVLIASILGEAYLTTTSLIQIPQNDAGVIMWHDVLYIVRQIVFLALPPVIHFVLPPSRSFLVPGMTVPGGPNIPVPQTPHSAAVMTLQALVPKLQLLRHARGAIMRNPTLRDAATEWWNTERQEGEWIREDEIVQSTARQLGLGFDAGSNDDPSGSSSSSSTNDGPLRANAKAATRNLMTPLRRTDLNAKP